MNRAKWNNSRIPISVLAAKFAEEAGEVAGAIADAEQKRITDNVAWQGIDCTAVDEIKAEVKHAEFLLGLIKERI